MTTEPAIFALPVVEYSRGLILPDGSVMACALDKPRHRWAVMELKPDGTQDAVLVLDDQHEAEALAQEIIEARAKGLQ